MTDTDTAAVDDAAVEPPAEGTHPDGSDSGVADTATTDDSTADEPESPSKREARYRRELRETQAVVEQQAAQIQALQRAEVERIAAATIQQPGALWSAGTELADLLDDTGGVEPDKVAEAATAAQETLGLAKPWAAPRVPREGTSIRQPAPATSFEDAFKP